MQKPEREAQPIEPVEVHPEEPSLPEKLEQATGVSVIPQQPQTSKVADVGITATPIDPTMPMPTTATVTVPADQTQAGSWSKGNSEDAKTWLGVLILRRIAIALKKGFRLIVGKGE